MPVTFAQRGLVTGLILDAQTRSFTVKRAARGKSREYTFAAENDAAAMLSQPKPGERVTVGFVDTNDRVIAEKITLPGRVAKK